MLAIMDNTSQPLHKIEHSEEQLQKQKDLIQKDPTMQDVIPPQCNQTSTLLLFDNSETFIVTLTVTIFHFLLPTVNSVLPAQRLYLLLEFFNCLYGVYFCTFILILYFYTFVHQSFLRNILAALTISFLYRINKVISLSISISFFTKFCLISFLI